MSLFNINIPFQAFHYALIHVKSSYNDQLGKDLIDYNTNRDKFLKALAFVCWENWSIIEISFSSQSHLVKDQSAKIKSWDWSKFIKNLTKNIWKYIEFFPNWPVISLDILGLYHNGLLNQVPLMIHLGGRWCGNFSICQLTQYLLWKKCV